MNSYTFEPNEFDDGDVIVACYTDHSGAAFFLKVGDNEFAAFDGEIVEAGDLIDQGYYIFSKVDEVFFQIMGSA